MAVMITVYCSMCGGQEPYSKPDLEFSAGRVDELGAEVLKRAVEARGWIVQLNGDDFDTYCTKQCAE